MDGIIADEVDLNVSVEENPLLTEELVPEQGRAPEDGDQSRGGGSKDSSQKRKFSEREPESPPSNNDIEESFTPFAKREKIFYPELEDSPASYPKHVLVPAAERQFEEKTALDYALEPSRNEGASVLTPDSLARRRDSSMDGSLFQRDPQFQEVYRAPSYQEIEYNRSYSQPPPSFEAPPMSNSERQPSRPRRWACDFCNVATFLSYEEACAHEAACAGRHQGGHSEERSMPHAAAPEGAGVGGALYDNRDQTQATAQQHQGSYQTGQEVVTPPTPHQQHQSRYSHGPPLPVLPHEQGYYHHHQQHHHTPQAGYYDMQDYYGHSRQRDPYGYYAQQVPATPYGYMAPQMPRPVQQKRMLLAMPTDNESLSDRQCYVRSEMLEIFAATEKDVAARHSKGAQKLQPGQVGIRCVHCAHLRPRDRAERAVCYPSSISRIYQTVADMQRFHFEQCQQIPEYVRQVYSKLKTTRPRGVGSPQTYWVQSAKSLGLVDTKVGIRFKTDAPNGPPPLGEPEPTVSLAKTATSGKKSDMSISTH